MSNENEDVSTEVYEELLEEYSIGDEATDPTEELPVDPEEETVPEKTAQEKFDEFIARSKKAYLDELTQMLYFAMDSRDLSITKILLETIEKESTRITATGLVLSDDFVEEFLAEKDK